MLRSTAIWLAMIAIMSANQCDAFRTKQDRHDRVNASSAPLRFYAELAKLKIYGYQAMFCENKKTVKEDGKCATIDNYPMPNSHVEMRHAKVIEQLKTVPERQRKGEIIKGNDLGFFILNQYLWSNDGEYKTIGLGVSVKDHEFIRPVFDKVVGKNGFWSYEDIAAEAKAYLDDKNIFDTEVDVMPFTTSLMHKIHFDMDLTPSEISDFTAFQSDCLLKIILPDNAVGLAGGAPRKKRDEWLQKYMDAIENDKRNAFPKGLRGRKPGGQLYILAAGFMDSILFAGGLSVEGLIKTALNVLHSANLPIEKEFRPIGEEDVEAFVYEVTRLFPPVVGFSWWAPGYDANRGGSTFTHRTTMNLAMSLRDPRVFGDNFDKFVVRDLPFYRKNMGNAWALPSNEILRDGTLGKMSRGCPGASLSVVVAKAFLTEYVIQQDQWAITGGTKNDIKWTDCTPFVKGFVKLIRGFSLAQETDQQSSEDACDKVVKGSVPKSSLLGYRGSKCQCPERTVISGSYEACKQKWDNYERDFNHDDPDFMILPEGVCECKHRPGCGMVRYEVDEVLPKNAAKAGVPPPLIIGTLENINTGVKELDQEFVGIFWMKDNPVPEELASMAGAFSRLTGKGPNGGSVPLAEADWNLSVKVPNSHQNHWSWPDTFTAKNVIMKFYTTAKADAEASEFLMYNTTHGEIETWLKDFPGVWVKAWYMTKIDEDTWLRTSVFQNRSLISGPPSHYTLTRVVKEDGEPTKYFKEFKDYMAKNQSDAKLLVWDTNDSCKRKCTLAGKACAYCHKCCTGGGYCWYN